MDVIINPVGVKLSDLEKNYIKEKIEKLLRYNQKIHRVQITAKVDNALPANKIIEIQVFCGENHPHFASKKGTTFQEAFDKGYNAIKRQLTEK